MIEDSEDAVDSLVNREIDDAIGLLQYLRMTFYAQKAATEAADGMARYYWDKVGDSKWTDGLPDAVVNFEVERQKVRELVDEFDGPISDEERAFTDWLAFGQARGWISETFCSAHDGSIMTDDEEESFDDGDDPCLTSVRIWGVRRVIVEEYEPEEDL